MYVPNYIPEPIEVPGNVTTEPYGKRLIFIRRVVLFHVASVALLVCLACVPAPSVGILPSLELLTLVLVILDLVRIKTRGRPAEPRTSVLLFPGVLVLFAVLARELTLAGYPVWALAFGPICGLLYSLLCGRDFSFVGCYLLSLIASTLCIASIGISFGLSRGVCTIALIGNAAYLFYWVYDLAALLARRRMGEELAAVVDLYRDVLNIFGYIPRVLAHWRKHRIWITPGK
jgi:FtsH-binding integral membrane protein